MVAEEILVCGPPRREANLYVDLVRDQVVEAVNAALPTGRIISLDQLDDCGSDRISAQREHDFERPHTASLSTGRACASAKSRSSLFVASVYLDWNHSTISI